LYVIISLLLQDYPVPELKVSNTAVHYVLLLDGEELNDGFRHKKTCLYPSYELLSDTHLLTLIQLFMHQSCLSR